MKAICTVYQLSSHSPRVFMLNFILGNLFCTFPLKNLTLPLVILDGHSPLLPNILYDTPLLARSFLKFVFFFICVLMYVILC